MLLTPELCFSLQNLVKDMKAPLRFTPHNDSAFLEQIPIDIGAGNASVRCEAYADELPKSARIVIPLGLRVPKGFEDRIGLKNLPLKQT